MDKTIAISSGWFLVGALLAYILLMGNPDSVESKPVPQDTDVQEDDKVSRLDFRKRTAS